MRRIAMGRWVATLALLLAGGIMSPTQVWAQRTRLPAPPAPTRQVASLPAGARPTGPATDSGEALWIWNTTASANAVPLGASYFRRSFEARDVELAMLQITADDRFEVFINGHRVGAASDWRIAQTYDVQKFLIPGRNLIAVKAENTSGTTAGLVARLTMRRFDRTEISYASDTRWRAIGRELPGWEQPTHNDINWPPARSFGEFGVAEPWGDRVVAADGSQSRRFTVAPDFRVERLVASEPLDSILAMTFNEFGEILASRENGPIILIVDRDEDGVPETVTTYCDQVINCQGLLALNGEVFAIGQGTEGPGLYRLSDPNQDGQAESVTRLITFDREQLGEHGPHAVALGPDGLIYVMIGNHTQPKQKPTDKSPFRHYYEGELFPAKYEDPSGHAAGIQAPCGTVLRTDAEGSFVERVAGGFRNAYDFAFNSQGDLFTYDSDMESDIGLPWYRPTRVLHVQSGGEYGSRSGWSVWPNYYADVVPPVLETDRGSPTGVEVYEHYAYPAAYHGALFVGDWSQGRILAVRLKAKGGTYEARSEVFLEGRPLNVTDLCVGPEGWLYFSTGGRGTEGGVYRVAWKGEPAPRPRLTGIMRAIRQPQLHSATSRQAIALWQQEIGADWDRQLLALAESRSALPVDRMRALDLAQLYGTTFDPRQLERLSIDPHPGIRAKAAFSMGLQPEVSMTRRLVELLADTDANVRRQACEAIHRGEYLVDAEPLVKLLGDPQRAVALAARRTLEGRPLADWKESILTSTQVRVFLQGALAWMSAAPSKEGALALAQRGEAWIQQYVSDDDFIDLLRVLEVVIIQGELKSTDLAGLSRRLGDEYPAGDWRMNRELVKLLVYLQESTALERMLEELQGTAPDREKLHLALHLRFLESGWRDDQRLIVLRYLEKAHQLQGGNSLAGYIDAIRRDFCGQLTEPERSRVLADALRMPGAALGVLATAEEPPQPPLVEHLIDVDRQLPEIKTLASKKLQTGIVAMLAISGQPTAFAYLRELYESSPERRTDVSMGLAQAPAENWEFLVRALGAIEGPAAQEVLAQLSQVDRRPEKPEALRQAILTGLRLGENGGALAVKLLARWTGEQPSTADDTPADALAAWQSWFTEKYPDELPAELPVDTQANKWNSEQLLKHLTTDSSNGQLPGDPSRGLAVFEKAACVKCHRFRGVGESIGPDLSTIGQRFQRKEILESILFPSHVISDQYAAKTIVTTTGLTYTGIVAPAGQDAIVILQSNAEKVTLTKDKIEEVAPSRKSAMPEGTMNNLSLEEITDLFAFLTSRAQPATAAPPGRLNLSK